MNGFAFSMNFLVITTEKKEPNFFIMTFSQNDEQNSNLDEQNLI